MSMDGWLDDYIWAAITNAAYSKRKWWRIPMKDTDKVELTVEAVKRAAGKCGTAKEVLKELFPEVFRESEWEDVTDGALVKTVYPKSGEVSIQVMGSSYKAHIDLFPDKTWSVYEGEGLIKIECGRIWRRKSA
jgi:hypothetical protein